MRLGPLPKSLLVWQARRRAYLAIQRQVKNPRPPVEKRLPVPDPPIRVTGRRFPSFMETYRAQIDKVQVDRQLLATLTNRVTPRDTPAVTPPGWVLKPPPNYRGSQKQTK